MELGLIVGFIKAKFRIGALFSTKTPTWIDESATKIGTPLRYLIFNRTSFTFVLIGVVGNSNLNEMFLSQQLIERIRLLRQTLEKTREIESKLKLIEATLETMKH